jgi:hypothetical protein
MHRTRNMTSIMILFQRENNKNHYNLDALLRQDVLRYCTAAGLQNGGSFRYTQIAKWLMKNNLEFVTYYTGDKGKTRMANRISARQRRITRAIYDLIDLNLIIITDRVRAQKNDLDTSLYSFTSAAPLLAWLIMTESTEDKNKREEAIKNIFDIISSHLNSKSDFRSEFLSGFLNRCHERGIFSEVVDTFRMGVLNDIVMYNEHALIDRFVGVMNTIYQAARHPEDFFAILDQLDEVARKALLLEFKIEIEAFYQTRHPSKVWEIMRLKNIGDNSKVIVLGFCSWCNGEMPFSVDIIQYLKALRSVLRPYPGMTLSTTCGQCGSEYGLSTRLMGLPWLGLQLGALAKGRSCILFAIPA